MKKEEITKCLEQIAHDYEVTPPLRIDTESWDVVEDVCGIFIEYEAIGPQELDLLSRIRDRIIAEEAHANDHDELGIKHRSIYKSGF